MDDELYEFDEFRVDARKRELWRDRVRVPVTPKVFDVLLLLVRSGGSVVTRESLIAEVWRDAFVEESNLTQTIFMLRKALGRGEGERYILTIPGKGYRLAAKVSRIDPVAPTVAEPAAPRRPRLLGAAAVAIVAIITIVTLIAAARWPGLRPSAAGRETRMMLAVLPFENLTGDAAQEYFSDGLTEEMITQIGKLDPHFLGVIARTSVMHYKNTVTPLTQIGDELKVQYVLEGSVRRDPEKVRITAKLVKVADQSPAWTREYDRNLTHLLALERDIAHDIAAEIQLTLEEKRGAAAALEAGLTPQAFEAYDAYLKGRYYWNKRTADGFVQAIKHFEQSIAADPHEARAYAGLADCYMLLPGYALEPQAPYVAKAREAALTAVKLNDGLAEAHTSLALLVENNDWDWPAAEREFRRAIELNPNYATAHHWYAEFLMWMGRFDEALVESERARQLDPLSLIIAADNGVILLYARRYDLAEKKLASVLELEPMFPRGHMIRFVYTETGRFDKALADITEATPDITPSDYAYIYGRAGRRSDAKRALEALEAYSARRPVDPGARAMAELGSGNVDKALAWLDHGYAERSGMMLSLKVDPAWDPLRGEPRFQELLKKMRLDGEPLHAP